MIPNRLRLLASIGACAGNLAPGGHEQLHTFAIAPVCSHAYTGRHHFTTNASNAFGLISRASTQSMRTHRKQVAVALVAHLHKHYNYAFAPETQLEVLSRSQPQW